MKLLVVGTGGEVVSGITTASDEMVRSLRSLGVDVERAVIGQARRKAPNRMSVENIREAVHDVMSVWRTARAHRAKVVWIHTFGVPTLPAVKALMLAVAARLACSKSVVHIHAFGLEASMESSSIALRGVLRLTDLMSERMIVLYEDAAASLRLATGARSVSVLENYVSVPDRVAPWPEPHPFTLVFVGALAERKGLPALIEAMELLDDVEVHLRLVGGPGEDGGVTLEGLAPAVDRLTFRGRLTLCGELPASEVRAEIRRANALVLPSSAEGTPMAVLEAMAEARPVIVTAAGNMAPLVAESGAGIVLVHGSAAEIAAAVGSLIVDAPAAARMGQRGRDRAIRARSAGIERVQDILRAIQSMDHQS